MDSQTALDSKNFKSKHADTLMLILEQLEEAASKQVSGWTRTDIRGFNSKLFEEIAQKKIQNRNPRSVLVVLVDLSGSMFGERIESVKQALQPYLGTQETFDIIALYGFNNKLIKIQGIEESRNTIQEKVLEWLKPDGKTAIASSVQELCDDILHWCGQEENKKNSKITVSNLSLQFNIVTDALAEELVDEQGQQNREWIDLRKKLNIVSERFKGLLFMKILSCSNEEDAVKALSRAFENEVLKVQPSEVGAQFDKLRGVQDHWNKKRKQFNSIAEQNLYHTEVMDFAKNFELFHMELEKILAHISGKENPEKLEKRSAAYEKRRKALASIFNDFFVEKLGLVDDHEQRVNIHLEKNRMLIRDSMKESARAENITEKVRIKEQLRVKQIDQQKIQDQFDNLKNKFSDLLRQISAYAEDSGKE